MATYAALVSLMNNLNQIQNHPRFSASLDKNQVESLGEKIDFFLDFVESCNSYEGTSKEETQKLEAEIASSANEAEDVIESYIVDQILPGSTEIIPQFAHLRRRCLFGLQKVILDMNSVKDRVLEFKEARKFNYQKATDFAPPASSIPFTTGKSIMVGFDDELRQLLDKLTARQFSRQIISIVGMGGAGKTTLARNVYEHSLIMHHFDLRAWATISQEYNVKDILLQLLCLGKSTDGTVEELGDRLYKILFGRRYLIILDDMWSTEVWDSMKFFFPDNGNGSRVVLTTRLSNLFTHLHSFCLRINYLDEYESWDLFCRIVFGEKECPSVLVGIGKKIVEQCKGLPLTIVVIGGLLRKSPRAEEYWQKVAQDVNSLLSSRENGECLDVLYLSYSQLPAHLKPCFLYMGSFKEDREIRVSEMIRLWVAEGFLKPIGVRILEEIAEDYLKDLIDRNLILVCAHRKNGKIRSCRIHDILRELCLWVAKKENFFCVVRAHSIPRGITVERRLIFHDKTSSNTEVFKALQSKSIARTLICDMPAEPVKCKLLRVLNRAFIPDLESAFQNVNLRYVAYKLDYFGKMSILLSSISLIWNLQTLIIRGSNSLIVPPLEIWRMPQVRHLNCSRISFPDPPPCYEGDDSVVLGNLQTLKRVSNFRLSEEVCKRIPNIKKFCLEYLKGYDDGLHENLCNLGRLNKLESLNLLCSEQISINELKCAFPSSLNKLSLEQCSVNWEDLSRIIGSLPQLEALKLKKPSCSKWSCVDGEFRRLKFLQIESCALEYWTLDGASYFPVLEKLVLVCLQDLREIPLGIGQIPTLQLIRLEFCKVTAALSAMKIKEEQARFFGNDGLQVQVATLFKKHEKLRERVKIEGLSMSNIHLELYRITPKRWNVLFCVLRWQFSIKKIMARKRLAAPMPPYHDGWSAQRRWNVLVWVLRWQFSIKRIMARKIRAAQIPQYHDALSKHVS